MVQWFKSMPSDAGDAFLICGQGTKIPHAGGQQSHNYCSATRESHTLQLERSPHVPQLRLSTAK